MAAYMVQGLDNNVIPPAAKIDAFRSFASQLAGQVVEQLCQEFEREVGIMFEDILQYRDELRRVAELLGEQLERERKLHDMLDTINGHHASIAEAVNSAASSRPTTGVLHEMVDQLFGQHQAALGSALGGADTARSIADMHAQSSGQLQEPLINAENEFKRIMDLLSVPLVPAAAPAPTMAFVPAAAREAPILSGAYSQTVRPVLRQSQSGSYVPVAPAQPMQTPGRPMTVTASPMPTGAVRQSVTPAAPGPGMMPLAVGQPMSPIMIQTAGGAVRLQQGVPPRF